jgi:hypothetical protein
MPIRQKVRDERVFRDSQASIEPPNPAFTMPFLSSYESRTMSSEVWSLTVRSKEVKCELLYVRF